MLYQNYLKIHPNCLNEDEKKYILSLLTLSKPSEINYVILLQQNGVDVRYVFKHLKKHWICIGIVKTEKGRIKCHSSHSNKQKAKELTSKMLWSENLKKEIFRVFVEPSSPTLLLNDIYSDSEIEDEPTKFHLEYDSVNDIHFQDDIPPINIPVIDINIENTENNLEEVSLESLLSSKENLIERIKEKIQEKDLLDIVEDTSILDKTTPLWITKDDMAKSIIISLLPCEFLIDIGLKSTSKEMWDSLLNTNCKNPPLSPLIEFSDEDEDEYIIIKE